MNTMTRQNGMQYRVGVLYSEGYRTKPVPGFVGWVEWYNPRFSAWVMIWACEPMPTATEARRAITEWIATREC